MNKYHEVNPFLPLFFLLLPQAPPQEAPTKQCLVFGRLGFHEDSQMPSRKAESCPHRKWLGQNVAALRARRDLTQEELAEKVDVSPRYIQSVEAGEYFPSLPVLVRLRAVLKCNWNELFAGCDRV